MAWAGAVTNGEHRPVGSGNFGEGNGKVTHWRRAGSAVRSTGNPRGAQVLARGRSPPAAAPHLLRREKNQAPRLRCCRCGRGPVALRLCCGSAARLSSCFCSTPGVGDGTDTVTLPAIPTGIFRFSELA